MTNDFISVTSLNTIMRSAVEEGTTLLVLYIHLHLLLDLHLLLCEMS